MADIDVRRGDQSILERWKEFTAGVYAKMAAVIPYSAAGVEIAPLTDAQLRATAVPVSDGSGSLTVDGGVTDLGSGWASSIGVAGARFTSADASGAPAAVHTAPAAGLKAVITDIIVSVGSALTVTFTEETAGTILFTLYMAANSTIQLTPRGELKLSTAVKRLMVQTSGAGNIAVTTFYYTEA